MKKHVGDIDYDTLRAREDDFKDKLDKEREQQDLEDKAGTGGYFDGYRR